MAVELADHLTMQKRYYLNHPLFKIGFMVTAFLLCSTVSNPSLAAVVTVEKSDGQIVISWPKNLGTVQLQRADTLGGDGWRDLGGATTETSFTDDADAGVAFYRLQLAPPRGIYIGNFEGQTESGGMAFMVDSEGAAVILGYSPEHGRSMVATNLQVSAEGMFGATSDTGGEIAGLVSGRLVSGTFTAGTTNVLTKAFSGELRDDSGIHEGNAGYYAGTFGGLLSGDASLILAADGTMFVYTYSNVVGGGGAFGMVDSENKVFATTEFTLPGTEAPGILTIEGALDPATHQFAGTYGFGGFQLGTISIGRVSVP